MEIRRNNGLFFVFIALWVLLLSACTNKPVNSLPAWVDEPDRNQAVGSCSTHALGKYKQKECAMTRARLELAARQGVDIQSMSVMTENANNISSSSKLSQQTVQEVNSKIKARLVDSYHDKAQDVLWVLMEEN